MRDGNKPPYRPPCGHTCPACGHLCHGKEFCGRNYYTSPGGAKTGLCTCPSTWNGDKAAYCVHESLGEKTA